MRNRAIIICVLLFTPMAWATGPQSLTDEVASDDTHASACNPDSSYGSSTQIYLQPGKLAFFQFDLAGTPDDSHNSCDTIISVDSASLEMTLHPDHSVTGITYDFYRLTETFDESTLTYNTMPSYDDSKKVTYTTTSAGSYQQVQIDVSSLLADNGHMDTFGLRMVCTDNKDLTALIALSKEFTGWPGGNHNVLDAEYETGFSHSKIFSFHLIPTSGSSYIQQTGEYKGFHVTMPEICPVPRPGYYSGNEPSDYEDLYSKLHADNYPLTMFVDFHGGQTVDDVTDTFSYAPRMDYIFMDFEGDSDETNTSAIIAAVTGYTGGDNPGAYTKAKIGNYDFFPGATDTSIYFNSNRSAADEYYNDNKESLKVAMPVMYPYECYSIHTKGANPAPNVRSALFWAPLEHFSVASRALHDVNDPSYDSAYADHELIPWINRFRPYDGYDLPGYNYHAEAPTWRDNYEMLRHARLRGADGYYTFRPMEDPDNPGVYLDVYGADAEEYRQDMMAAWISLDYLFDNDAEVTFLNLTTDKVSGIQWSGATNDDGEFAFLISNLTDEWYLFEYVDDAGLTSSQRDGYNLPYGTWVAPFSHAMVMHAPEPFMGCLLAAGLVFIKKKRRKQD